MTYESAFADTYTELALPPRVPAFEADGRATQLLAREDVREGLFTINEAISNHYASLEEEGTTVQELYRGVTPEGVGVAVATIPGRAETDVQKTFDLMNTLKGSKPELVGPYFKLAQTNPAQLSEFCRENELPTNLDGHIVFLYDLEDITSEPTLPDPSVVFKVENTRGNTRQISIVKPDGKPVMITVPLSQGNSGFRMGGREILPFSEAAFGKRRREVVEGITGNYYYGGRPEQARRVASLLLQRPDMVDLQSKHPALILDPELAWELAEQERVIT